jgi:hypothetical protein
MLGLFASWQFASAGAHVPQYASGMELCRTSWALATCGIRNVITASETVKRIFLATDLATEVRALHRATGRANRRRCSGDGLCAYPRYYQLWSI